MNSPSPFRRASTDPGDVIKIFLGLVEEFDCPDDFQIDVKLPEGGGWPALFLKHRTYQQAFVMASGLEHGVNVYILDKALQDHQRREYVYEHPAMVEHFHGALLELIDRYRADRA